jgi:pyrimidine-nucleoside phosphorylase
MSGAAGRHSTSQRRPTRDPRDLVAIKRDGGSLAAEDVRALVDGFMAGDVSAELAAAFLMAAYVRGLDAAETAALADAFVASGETIELPGVDRPIVDKHSTGGVADGVTLVFVPLAASLGLAVAKLSGRGLGYTGGTLDKLESIPGLRTDLSPDEFRRQVADLGCAVAGQGPGIVPADGAMYALRDATATVASISLVAASVMAKKLAIASDLVLLDVKAGTGAFMKDADAATALATLCVEIGRARGRRTRAVVSDMSQPLGRAIGNALDVAEAVDVLRGAPGRLRALAVELVAEATSAAGGLARDAARRRAERVIDDGTALERFRELVAAQGGDPSVVDDPASVLPAAPVVHHVASEAGGILVEVDAEGLGRASGALGAGRARRGDRIDPAVGIVLRPEIGDDIAAGDEVAVVHARTANDAKAAARAIGSALTLGEGPGRRPPLLLARFE